MKFSKQQIKELGELARLDLSPEEITIFGQQLSSILDFINILNQAPTSTNDLPRQALINVWRLDEARPWDKTERDLALDQGKRESGFVIAPPALSIE